MEEALGLNGNEILLARNNPFRWKGFYYDADNAVYRINGRCYSPSLMQYLQPELSTITPEKTNGLDLYCFANNNPVSVRIGGISGGNSGANYGKLSNSSKDWFDLKPIPSWVESAIDISDIGFSTSIVGLTAWYTLKYPGVADLMKLDGIAKIPGKYSNFVEGLGYAFVFLETGIDMYNNWQQGQSAAYIWASGAYTLGTGIAITWGSAQLGTYIGILVGGPVGFIVGGAAGVLIGLGLEWLSEKIKEWLF